MKLEKYFETIDLEELKWFVNNNSKEYVHPEFKRAVKYSYATYTDLRDD